MAEQALKARHARLDELERQLSGAQEQLEKEVLEKCQVRWAAGGGVSGGAGPSWGAGRGGGAGQALCQAPNCSQLHAAHASRRPTSSPTPAARSAGGQAGGVGQRGQQLPGAGGGRAAVRRPVWLQLACLAACGVFVSQTRRSQPLCAGHADAPSRQWLCARPALLGAGGGGGGADARARGAQGPGAAAGAREAVPGGGEPAAAAEPGGWVGGLSGWTAGWVAGKEQRGAAAAVPRMAAGHSTVPLPEKAAQLARRSFFVPAVEGGGGEDGGAGAARLAEELRGEQARCMVLENEAMALRARVAALERASQVGAGRLARSEGRARELAALRVAARVKGAGPGPGGFVQEHGNSPSPLRGGKARCARARALRRDVGRAGAWS